MRVCRKERKMEGEIKGKGEGRKGKRTKTNTTKC
jgi:hypothetical protein